MSRSLTIVVQVVLRSCSPRSVQTVSLSMARIVYNGSIADGSSSRES